MFANQVTYIAFHINKNIMFGFLLLYICSTQNGMTAAELAQSRGYRDIAKLIIDEGMYFIIYDNNFIKT